MKKLDVTPISASAQMPLKKGTLQFLQDANSEAFNALLIALIGSSYNTSTVYVLYGVIFDDWATPNFSCNAGAAFYNGEIYLIDSTVFSVTGSDLPVFSLGVTQYTNEADPVTFTDGSVHNVHNIRKLVISAGASGSGIADFTSASFLNFTIPAQLNLTAGGSITISGTYPNLTISTPGTSHPILAAGTVNVGDIADQSSGGTDVNITFPTALSTANYYVMGTIVSNNGASGDITAHDTQINWSLLDTSRSTTGFTVHFMEWNSVTQNVSFDWIVFQK